jgi:hypothetical protein
MRSDHLTHYEKPPLLGRRGISPFLRAVFLQIGPRRQGFASPQKNAPLTAAGRSAHLSAKKEWGSLDWRTVGSRDGWRYVVEAVRLGRMGKLLYRRRTRRACSLFQRLALPQRLLLHFAKSATALTILKSSVCQNDSFWRATSGSRGSPEPGTRPWQVSLGFKLTTSVRVCPWRRSRKIGLVRFLD